MATIDQTSDFVILGPTLARDNNVFEAIYALYFLPENYKMVFAGGPADRLFYNEVVSLVDRNDLRDRVRFDSEAKDSHAVIVPNAKTVAKNSVSGDSAEALANAILDVARSTS